VSKTWEHYHHAARDHGKAAYHLNEAAKYNQAAENEKQRIRHTWLTDIASMEFIMMLRPPNGTSKPSAGRRLFSGKHRRRRAARATRPKKARSRSC